MDMAELGIDPDWMEHTTVMFPRPKERVTVGSTLMFWTG
jgi:hypothetical protein